MRAGVLIRYFLIGCMALLVLVSCRNKVSTSQVATDQPTPTSILFIGNSYTDFNNGMDQQLQGLAPVSKASRIAPGGYTLEKHWTDGNTLQAIRQQRWGYVVLQEQSQTPVFNFEKFRQFAKAFDQEIKVSGAKTILWMTWERPDSVGYGVTTANLAAAYTTVGKDVGAKVAPVGLAFERSLRERPDLTLYSSDGHPTVNGTYLAACVLYGTIFARSPVGNAYSDQSIPPETRAYLQKIAADSLG